MSVVNLTEKLSCFSEHWSPKVVAEFNGQDVMVVKVKGEFVWHPHPPRRKPTGRAVRVRAGLPGPLRTAAVATRCPLKESPDHDHRLHPRV